MTVPDFALGANRALQTGGQDDSVPTAAFRSALTQIRSGLRVAALLRHPPISAAGYEETLRVRLARREEHFLWSVEHLIFANLHSPYRPLLELAGYDLPKIRQLVAARGLDAALDQLRDDGVYVRIQEFKASEPTVRGGRTFQFQERDFANPTVRPALHMRSGGSRSLGTQTEISTADLVDHMRLFGWLDDGYGLTDRDIILWNTPGVGLLFTVAYAAMGRSPLRWFSPVGYGGWASPLMFTVARLASGVHMPRLEVMPADRVLDVARYISRVNTPRGILVRTFVNTALRLVLAAEETGIRLGDVVLWTGGEPLTPAKRRQIEERGFRIMPGFGISELGLLGAACPAGQEPDDLHLFTDRVAVRQYSRAVDGNGSTVPAYLLTSLLPHTRHVMLNMECGDYGGLEERSCGCFLERVGFRLHMHTIRSFEKLTAEGITFVGPALVDLIEEVLPREFGGDSRHYQLVEAEDRRGFTKLYVLASPRLGPLDEEALRRRVLQEIGGRHLKGAYGRVVAEVWEHADTVQVLRRDPVWTSGGKILHLHRDRGALRVPEGDRATPPTAHSTGEEPA